jgi:hypothetical protein
MTYFQPINRPEQNIRLRLMLCLCFLSFRTTFRHQVKQFYTKSMA